MSKKEQKLKKNLYKALTEYFIHNAKNSLASSESILDQLASFRMDYLPHSDKIKNIKKLRKTVIKPTKKCRI